MDIWRFLSGHTDSMGYTLAQSLNCFDGWAHESTLYFYFKLHCWKPQLNGYVGANHLWSGVRIPCTPSTLFIVKFCATCIRHCAEKRMKINKKRPGLAQNYIVEVHGGEVADYLVNYICRCIECICLKLVSPHIPLSQFSSLLFSQTNVTMPKRERET